MTKTQPKTQWRFVHGVWLGEMINERGQFRAKVYLVDATQHWIGHVDCDFNPGFDHDYEPRRQLEAKCTSDLVRAEAEKIIRELLAKGGEG